MKQNDEFIRQLAHEERSEAEVPVVVHSAVEETLSSLSELPEKTAIVPMKQKRRYWKLPATIAAAFLAIFLILPNTGYTMAHALSQIPVLGSVFEAVTFREYSEETADTEVKVRTPKITAEQKGKDAANEVSKEIDALNQKAVARFKQEHANGEQGTLDIDYSVVANTDQWYTVQVVREETAASSDAQSDYYTFNKENGKRYYLYDLFEGNAYIAHISENIREQMRAQMKRDKRITYFLDSDTPEEDFQQIAPNQNFYIDQAGDLIICFNQFEVAPGSEGAVRFRIPMNVYQADLKTEFQ